MAAMGSNDEVAPLQERIEFIIKAASSKRSTIPSANSFTHPALVPEITIHIQQPSRGRKSKGGTYYDNLLSSFA